MALNWDVLLFWTIAEDRRGGDRPPTSSVDTAHNHRLHVQIRASRLPSAREIPSVDGERTNVS